jgi:biopolymer transport protein ExbD
MNPGLRASIVSVMLAAIAVALAAQSDSAPPQRGVHVELPVTRNAVAVPNADKPDAPVLALTADGTAYLRANRVAPSALANNVQTLLATQTDKTLYIKADARVPYARLVEVIDTLRQSGVEGLTLLTEQQDPADQRQRFVSPKGLELRVVRQRP